ncbi:hypothetical protein MUP46_03035 [Patescibacteria group bacterium]|nr:hypothetical protein [Patescibacteria group bacterium]
MALDLAAILAIIAALSPLIDQVITWIERLFPKAQGTVKKDAATKTINALMPAAAQGIPDIAEVISKSIDQRVTILNQAGKFKHKGSTKK